jgi:ubiquitin carboxyl-terminal hydrolase 8|tara:strand:+ start:853 stop:1905 length:1053 start_codon:yes stop_codon:yes gene_type:complete
MELKKYQRLGYIGLENLGNTCFLNSCLQVLSNTYELNDLLDNVKVNVNENNKNDNLMFKEWIDLKSTMWSGNGTVSPKRFVLKLKELAVLKKKDLFTGHSQNDLPEFLLFFMDCIHNSISRKVVMNINGNTENNTDKLAVVCYKMLKDIYSKEYSEIMDMFYGIYVSEIKSIETKRQESLTPQSYFILDLPIFVDGEKQMVASNLYGCLDLFTQPEYLTGENAWFNERTGKKEDIQKRMIFWNFPNILIITLNRFSIDGLRRINKHVDFPIDNLDLTNYVHGYNKESFVYDLYGVCNHMGSLQGGHYTAFVRNYANQWIHYDDETNEKVKDLSSLVTPSAYCLFYRKKNT